MTSVSIFGVEFVCKDEDGWLDVIREFAEDAYECAGVDPEDDKPLFDDFRYDT